MSITTIIGPMFSGKTSEFIRLIDRKRISGKQCLIIKYSKDNRYDTETIGDQIDVHHITTHSEIRYKKCDIIYLSDFLNDTVITSIQEKYDVLGIDEGFFFAGICQFCNILANHGIDVIVASLESSFEQKLFPEIGDLIAISEDVIKLKAICMQCKNADASFTIRTVNSDELYLVGGSEMYQSVCRKCLNNFNNLHRAKNKKRLQYIEKKNLTN